jgi:alkaline phosphatase
MNHPFLRSTSKITVFSLTILLHGFVSGVETLPKNIILMIADGCGFNHVEALSLYRSGKPGSLGFQQFPVKLAMSTYSISVGGYNPEEAWKDFKYVTRKYTDSAAAATAMATGTKTWNNQIGTDTLGHPLENIVEYCESVGKATGIVTSVQFCDATPAAFAAHNIERHDNESISGDMILESGLEVLMGAGHPEYDKKGRTVLPGKQNYKNVGGKSLWQNLREGKAGNDCDGDGIQDPWFLIENREDFIRLPESQLKRVIGIPKCLSELQYDRIDHKSRNPFRAAPDDPVPTLAEMASGAIHILSADPDGFFLMIEGGAIDWASHDKLSAGMIGEMAAFDEAVNTISGWIESQGKWDETLLVITADHETGYLWGPAGGGERFQCCSRKDRWQPLEARGPGAVPGMKWNRKTHTNSLVPFYAKGAGSEGFLTLADETDPVRGLYLDNAELGKMLFHLAGDKQGL